MTMFKNIDIDMARTLTFKRDRQRVLGKFLTWAKSRGFDTLPHPDVSELRWNDSYTLLWVSKLSPLIEHGFETLYPEHKPLIDSEKWAIYSDVNPAASVLLNAIREQVEKHHLEA